jgi:hypothetical protein
VSDRCVFCGSRERLTKEDIIPLWTHPFLPGGDPDIRHKREAGGDWTLGALRWTVKAPCRRCNNGWMSGVEARAKPLLTDAIQAKPCVWSRRDQRRVATWAFKTALMGALGAGVNKIPDAHFRFLYGRRHPPGVARIWAIRQLPATDNSTFPIARILPSWVHFEDGSDTWAYWVVVTVGFVGFAVFSSARLSERDAWRVRKPAIDGVQPDRYEVQIWPQSATSAHWPPPVHFDPGGLERYAKT